MSDHDRGGYAPYNEAPLAFDSYESRPRGRRPLPMALIGSGVVLVLLITALVMFYLSGSKSAEGTPRPVGGGIASIKTAPAAGQPTDPAAGLEVYSPQNVPSGNVAGPAAPQFAPTPEQPLNRPAAPPPVATAPVARPAPPPHAQTVAAAPVHTAPATPAAKAAPEAPAPATPKTVAHASPAKAPAVKPTVSAKVAAVKPKASPVATSDDEGDAAAPPVRPAPVQDEGAITTSLAAKAKAAPKASKPVAETTSSEPTAKAKATKPAAKPKLAKAAPTPAAETADEDVAGGPDATLPKGALNPTKPVPPPASNASKGGYVVQVGAFASAALADQGFAQASSKVSGAAGKSKHVETVQKDGKTYYRSTLRGFGSKSDAAAFCAALRAKGGQCIVRGAGA